MVCDNSFRFYLLPSRKSLALLTIDHSPKRSGTRPVRCPFLFRTIVKRHAMTGSRLGRYAEIGQPPGSGGDKSGARAFRYRSLFQRFVTCPVRCLVYRSIVKRHAITGSRLGRYARTGQPPGS
ncbi:MAG: hypothetical protein Q8S57_07195 [Methanoregula sp.]|nr:hypothetical protein [Methanoregula sp.]